MIHFTGIDIPSDHLELLELYSSELRGFALQAQKEKKMTLAEMVGMIVHSGPEDIVGVMLVQDWLSESHPLMAKMPRNLVESIKRFLSGDCPVTSLRIVTFGDTGVSCAQLSLLPVQARGQA